MDMSTLALTPRPAPFADDGEVTAAPGSAVQRSLPHLAGASIPAPLHTAGALGLLLLAVAATGVLLVAFAVTMPVLLLVAALMGRRPRRERPGWRAAPA